MKDDDTSLHIWRPYLVGGGKLEKDNHILRLVVTDATSRTYSDAQIDDYRGLPRRCFLWHPPLRMTVKARFSHSVGALSGTAGFGFWNDPFLMTGWRTPTLPRAIWFFYASPPSNLKLDLDVPGCGWKAATIDALRPITLVLAPTALLAVPLMNLRPFYFALWPYFQRALHIRESLINVEMTRWHTYSLYWTPEKAVFSVNGEHVLENAPSPRGPLGFVMWLDNQYMVVTPQGRFRWGLLDVPGHQWMEVAQITIERCSGGFVSSKTPGSSLTARS